MCPRTHRRSLYTHRTSSSKQDTQDIIGRFPLCLLSLSLMGTSQSYIPVSNGGSTRVTVLAPTYGIVEEASPSSIVIYIDARDNHSVHSVVSGYVSKITTYQGEILRPIRGRTSMFQAFERKTGRVTISYELGVSVDLEVGEGYITDRVQLEIKEGDWIAPAGKRIGEILLGSLSEVHLPGPPSTRILVKKGDVLQGGVTPIAMFYA